MNKQQLAAKIWESANQMRSKIEANEYKDYILGFIFYKYLSDKLVRFAKSEDFSDEELRALSESDTETVDHISSTCSVPAWAHRIRPMGAASPGCRSNLSSQFRYSSICPL